MSHFRKAACLICVAVSLQFGSGCNRALIEAHIGRPLTTSEAAGLEASPRDLGHQMVVERWGESAWPCVDFIVMHESAWSTSAHNPSGAHGIPQALPGSKMASAGPNWRTDAKTQILWMLSYIEDRYGTACKAAAFKKRTGWY